jgi:ectoine hydroxylase-related dioxygenase (phytanoyl-CoA dioxygenase family)
MQKLFVSSLFLVVTSAFFAPQIIQTKRQRDVQLHSVVQSVVTEENGARKFMYMKPEQNALLREQGDREASLMKKQTKLKATKIKVSLGGFGAKKTKPDVATQASALAKVLKEDGLVRIDNVLDIKLCDSLKDYLVDLRARATADIERNVIIDSQDRFADVLLNQNRCDLKIPLGPDAVNEALHHILSQTVVRPLIETIYDSYGVAGREATLYELNCFMSNTSALRQLVHADVVCIPSEGLAPDEPIMLTCFVALQDTDVTMGPTIFLPGTHNQEAHDAFFGSGKEDLLLATKSVVGVMPKGSVVLFDPRTLHCAGANICSDPEMTRALFYFSFKNPRVDSPGCPSCSGYGIAGAELPLHQLCKELEASVTGQEIGLKGIDRLACFP